MRQSKQPIRCRDNKFTSQSTARFSKERDPNKRFTVSIGVSENPLDGTEAEELIDKARELLVKSKEKNPT